MTTVLLGIAGAASVVALVAQSNINPTDPQPTCRMCPGYYIPVSELEAYTKKAVAEKLTDQQVRDVEIGKAHVGIGMVHRGKLDAAPNSVAEHDQVSEVYHIIAGTATLVLGPDITTGSVVRRRSRRFASSRTRQQRVRDPQRRRYQLKAGDVVVIPAGTGHWFRRSTTTSTT